jgi:hypothetical protein
MGLELDAFLGKTGNLQRWIPVLSSAVVCPLSGDLSLVPITWDLFKELRSRIPRKEADRLDAGSHTSPSPSEIAAAERWGARASADGPVAFVSLFEFGDDYSESVSLWSGGALVGTNSSVAIALKYFREQAGVDLGTTDIAAELEKHRGETAVDKWVATGKR